VFRDRDRDRDRDRRAATTPQPVKMRLHVVRVNQQWLGERSEYPVLQNSQSLLPLAIRADGVEKD
jgi:hypothetical protein